MSLLLDAGIVFAVLAVGSALAHRLGQSVIPAYIVAGVALGSGPEAIAGYAIPAFASAEFVELLAELGVVLLLFLVGLEFNLERLLASRDAILRAGGIDLLVNGSVGLLVAFALGFGPVEALFVAGIVYISSSAVITKTLVDLGWIADPESEAVIGVLVFEDVVVAVYLAVLSALALGGTPAGVATSLAVALGFIVALVALAAVGTGPLERYLDTEAEELFLVRVIAAVALSSGLGPAIPAIAVGYVLVMSLLGTVLMRYSSPFERIVERRIGSPAG